MILRSATWTVTSPRREGRHPVGMTIKDTPDRRSPGSMIVADHLRCPASPLGKEERWDEDANLVLPKDLRKRGDNFDWFGFCSKCLALPT